MRRRMIGLNLSPDAIRLVELERSDSDLEAMRWSADFFPSLEIGDEYAKKLAALLKKNRIPRLETHLVLSGKGINYKIIELPAMPDKEVPAALGNKLSAVFSRNIEQLVYGYYKISENTGGQQLFFVVVAEKSFITKALAAVKKTGLRVKEVVPGAIALRNGVRLAKKTDCALIHLGKNATLIVLVKKGRVVFARQIEIGLENIVRSMVGEIMTAQGHLVIDYEKARRTLVEFGVPYTEAEEGAVKSDIPPEERMATMRPALEKIGAEILRTFEYYQKESGDSQVFGRALISGEAAGIKGLMDYYRDQLGIEMDLISYDGVVSSNARDFVRFAHSLTECFGGVVQTEETIGLLPYEYRHPYQKAFSQVANVWTAGLVYAVILVSVWTGVYMQQQEVRLQLTELQEELGRRAINATPLSETQKLTSALLGQGETANLVIQVMNSLEAVTPPEIYFKSLSYNRDNRELLINGVLVEDRGDIGVSRWIQAMKATGLFESIDLPFLVGSDRFTVPTFDFKVRCVLANGGGQ